MNRRYIQKLGTILRSIWEKFIQNRPVYKKLCVEYERITDAFNKLRSEYDKLLVKQDALSEKYERVTGDLDDAQGNLNTLQAEHEGTKTYLVETHQKYNALHEEHERTATALAEARHNLNKLSEEHNQTQAALAEARVEYERTTDAFKQLSEEHDKLLLEQGSREKKYKQAKADLNQAQGDLNLWIEECEKLLLKQDVLSKKYERVTGDLDDAQGNLNTLQAEHEQTSTALAEERAEHERAKAAFNKLRGEHGGLSQKYKLVSGLLAAKPNKNEKFEEFKKLVKKDFMTFANKESSLAEEADAVRKMQTIEKRLEEIVAFPHTFTKKSIAIGGAFSSGKSEFVNSFITGSNVKMPVDVKPTTAIPSFVTSSSEVSIKGFSCYGATVDIEPEFYNQLSHDFIKTFSFNLKDLLPSITVEVPLAKGLFEKICLIDTPGYNSEGRNTTEDRSIAAASLKGRDALIWMIDVRNGTVPSDDLKFINDLELDGLPFYVILNRADRQPTALKDILDKVKETLEYEGIEPIVGISAYSATRCREYLYDGMSLHDFFRSQNDSKKNIEDELRREIKEVFEMYEKAIEDDKKKTDSLKDQLKHLELDLLESGMLEEKLHDDVESQIKDIRVSLKRNFSPIEKQMSQIKKKMLKAVDEIFWSLSSQSAEAESQLQSTHASRWSEKEGSGTDTDTKVGSRPESDGRRSKVRRQGYIKGGKYIKTDAEQSGKSAFANPQPRFDSHDFKKKPKKSKRVYEVAHEFNLWSTEMIALLRNLGFQVKDHMSVCTPVMVEAVQRALGAERQNNKKNTEATKRIGEVAREFNLSSSTMLTLLRNLGFKSRSPSSICTQEMVEAVQRELDTERQAKKKSTQAASQTQELININQATAKELEGLLGIGPKIAKRIVAYRKQNGLFQRIDDLVNVRGISLKILRALRSTLEWNLIDVLRQAKKQ